MRHVEEAMSPVTVVLVGCGSISKLWLDAAAEIGDLSIVGLVDLVEAAAQARAEQYGLADALIGVELESVLEEVHPVVVFNCTVPEAHVDVTLAALAHGCHVLTEKPLADSMVGAWRIVRAAAKAGKICAVMQNRRYHPGLRRLRSFLDSGGLGRITTLNTDFYTAPQFGGFRDRMRHVLLLDMAIHTFDAARFLSRADPVSVLCKEWNPQGSWYDHDASAVAVFEMSGGVVYTYRGSWCADGRNTSWEGDWRIIGEQGSVTWEGADGFEAQIVSGRGEFRSELAEVEIPPHDTAGQGDGHASCIREFVRCVRTGDAPETNCTDNIKSLAMVFGAIESAAAGRVVQIEL